MKVPIVAAYNLKGKLTLRCETVEGFRPKLGDELLIANADSEPLPVTVTGVYSKALIPLFMVKCDGKEIGDLSTELEQDGFVLTR